MIKIVFSRKSEKFCDVCFKSAQAKGTQAKSTQVVKSIIYPILKPGVTFSEILFFLLH